ncbi:hypothetical protein BE221DRAFT_205467 [Ostreococcus tauri]|uniref:Uncharacterized protein n=1 Tax=Ostreococcus tauri TaxID=70448 RepID=A0A1Y5IHN0_OSTTA|nr:hypothetical protein BE221DRAFT_205467 [Ostreococcus tauri]
MTGFDLPFFFPRLFKTVFGVPVADDVSSEALEYTASLSAASSRGAPESAAADRPLARAHNRPPSVCSHPVRSTKPCSIKNSSKYAAALTFSPFGAFLFLDRNFCAKNALFIKLSLSAALDVYCATLTNATQNHAKSITTAHAGNFAISRSAKLFFPNFGRANPGRESINASYSARRSGSSSVFFASAMTRNLCAAARFARSSLPGGNLSG